MDCTWCLFTGGIKANLGCKIPSHLEADLSNLGAMVQPRGQLPAQLSS